MKQLLKSYIIKTLAVANSFPTGMTDRSELRFLLKKLYPLSTNKELIRLGPKGDGGYLVPNDLVGVQACFSPGVSFVSGFEKDCAELGMKVFLADKSVDRPAAEHELFSFTKKFVGAISNADFMTMDNWVTSSLPEKNSDLLLQIDIEGYEYEVFLSTSEALMQRFRIIVAEFHHLDQLWSRPFFNLASRAFDKILQTHACVHIHPNNCCGSLQKDGLNIPRIMEFTFLRSDRIEHPSYQKYFPNLLDYDNTANPSLALPKCWYSEE
ncbi:MAG: FkbM family methyltransferase [Rubrivivax sp.]|nr:FkbM family methyltransferase [Rubrivivax sp.]